MSITIEELWEIHYLPHCRVYYRKPSGRSTCETAVITAAVDRLLRVPLPAEDGQLWITGAALEAKSIDSLVMERVQELMISEGLSRKTINHYVHKIRAMFKWAARKRLVPAAVCAELQIVEPLRMGRTNAKETKGLTDVAWETVETTAAFASLKLSTMIQLQWLTGMRSGELVRMQKSRITPGKFKGKDCWRYSPAEHKTEHHGKVKTIKLGPKAVALLRSWSRRVTGDWLFEGSIGLKPTGKHMTVSSYRLLIRRAAKRAKVPLWTPHQVRHSFATRARKLTHSLDDARALLGHSDITTTELYIAADETLMDEFVIDNG